MMYDLIIAGGGPSGSSAARTAARLGLDVLLIEKERFPRYKPCGGALSERALSYLDFSLPDELCERNITGARVHFKDQVIELYKNYRLTVLTTRSRFDHFLLKKAEDAGALVAEGMKVEDYSEKDDHVEVEAGGETHRSRFLLVSSGCQDRLKERIRGRDRRDQYGICMVTEVPEDDQLIDERIHNALELHFGVARMGYGWIFPHRGYYSVGIGGLAERLKSPRAVMNEFLKTNGFNGRYELHGHVIPFGGMSRRLSGDRVLLTGDSAGFVDAFTGEGIAYAIRSGQIASEAVSRGLDDSKLRVPDAYRSGCKSDFGDELKYALLFAKLMHSQPDIFFKVLTGKNDVLDKYIEIVGLKRTYKSYLKWLVPRMPGRILGAI